MHHWNLLPAQCPLVIAPYAGFYGLPRNKEKITLRKEEWQVLASVGFGEHRLVPLRAGEKMKWKLV